MECAQLVKANSIEGCVSLHRRRVLGTTCTKLLIWLGAIGYHDRGVRNQSHWDNSIVNRISKTKREEFPNFQNNNNDFMRSH